MANEVAIIKDNWLELSTKLKDLPAPYQQEIFLLECNVAGTSHVEDIENKTADLKEGSLLTLRRDPTNKYDERAIAVLNDKGERVGWVPMRRNAVFSRLMDAGKLLYARVESKEMVEGEWLDMRIKIYMRDV